MVIFKEKNPMKKIFCFVLLYFNTYAATDYAYRAADDDELRLNHLPKRLRADAVVFYARMEQEIKRISGSPVSNGQPYNLLVHMFNTAEWNAMNKPWHLFVDSCIREDGINVIKGSPSVLPQLDGQGYPLNPGLDNDPTASLGMTLGQNPLEFYDNFHDAFEALTDRRNPFGAFFLGLIHFRGIGVPENQNRGRNLLLLAAERDYGRAIRFLVNNYDPGFPEMMPLVILQERSSLLDSAESHIENFINNHHGRARFISEDDFERMERSLSYQARRVDKLFDFHRDLTAIITDMLMPMRRRTFSIGKLLKDFAIDVVTYGIPATLVGMYLEKKDEFSVTSYGELFDIKMLEYGLLAGSACGVSRLGYNFYPLLSNGLCGRRFFRKGTLDPFLTDEEIQSEARLASLYLTLLKRNEINRAINPRRADSLKTPVLRLLVNHLDGTDMSMSKVIYQYRVVLN